MRWMLQEAGLMPPVDDSCLCSWIAMCRNRSFFIVFIYSTLVMNISFELVIELKEEHSSSCYIGRNIVLLIEEDFGRSLCR